MVNTDCWKFPDFSLSTPEKGQLHLWRIDLVVEAHSSTTCLSAEERSRASRFLFSEGARRFTLARSAMRQILGNYLSVLPERIGFSYGELGKPEVSTPETDLRFNLTHAEDLALLAVTRGCNVGIDMEPVRERDGVLAIALRVFPEEVFNSLHALPKHHLMEAFLRHWTALEARAKAAGQGVFSKPGPDTPCANFQPAGGWMAAVAMDAGVPPEEKWQLLRFDGANFPRH